MAGRCGASVFGTLCPGERGGSEPGRQLSQRLERVAAGHDERPPAGRRVVPAERGLFA